MAMFIPDGAKLHISSSADGFGRVELNGEDISRQVADITITLRPGEIAYAVMKVMLSEIDLASAGATVGLVSADGEPSTRDIAEVVADILDERKKAHIAAIEARRS